MAYTDADAVNRRMPAVARQCQRGENQASAPAERNTAIEAKAGNWYLPVAPALSTTAKYNTEETMTATHTACKAQKLQCTGAASGRARRRQSGTSPASAISASRPAAA